MTYDALGDSNAYGAASVRSSYLEPATAAQGAPRANWRATALRLAARLDAARLPVTEASRPLGLGWYVARTSLLVITVALLGFSLNLVVLSGIDNRVQQTRAFDRLRNALALGTAPVGQVDAQGRLLAPGTAVALLEIPRLHMHEVVLEGTTSAVLTSGPGHLRNTVLPGQRGTSVVFGRAAAYGGPFGSIHALRRGDTVKVTTGIGPSTFKVIDVRRAGDPLPVPLSGNEGRLTLVTATGGAFMPSGVLRVDADLVGPAQPTAPLALTAARPNELPLAGDTGSLWELTLLLEALIVVTLVAVWSWRRWGKVQTWMVFSPLFVLFGWSIGGQVTRLLPNLM